MVLVSDVDLVSSMKPASNETVPKTSRLKKQKRGSIYRKYLVASYV